MAVFKDDAAGLLAFARGQQAIVERQVFNTADDADIVYSQFVPVVGGNPNAGAVTFLSTKGAGAAKFINANADDVPLADVAYDADTKPVRTAAIGYGWGWDELQTAGRMGASLQADKAYMARRAYNELVQKLVFSGDTAHGMVGLENLVGTDVSSGFTGKWTAAGNATAAAIAKDLITLVRGTGKGNQPTADRVVLPADDYTTALTTFFPNSSQTAIALVQQMFPGMQVTSRTSLESISGKHRYLAYRNSRDALAFYLPMPLTFLPVYQAGPLRFEVPGVFRVAGLNLKRKSDFAFAAKS